MDGDEQGPGHLCSCVFKDQARELHIWCLLDLFTYRGPHVPGGGTTRQVATVMGDTAQSHLDISSP